MPNTRTKTLFAKRHYEWLAAFAANARLSTAQIRELSLSLYRDNPKFKHERFMTALDNQRATHQTTNHTTYRGAFTTHNLK